MLYVPQQDVSKRIQLSNVYGLHSIVLKTMQDQINNENSL